MTTDGSRRSKKYELEQCPGGAGLNTSNGLKRGPGRSLMRVLRRRDTAETDLVEQ